MSSAIEADQRFKRHQNQAFDEVSLNALRTELGWVQMLPLRRSLEAKNDFPVQCLPEMARDFVCKVGWTDPVLQTMLGAGLIGAIFAAAHGAWHIREDDGHTQLINGYILVSAPSGMGKSQVIRFLRHPFEEQQREEQEKFVTEGKRDGDEYLKAAIAACRKRAKK